MPLYAWPGVRLYRHSVNTAALLLVIAGPELDAAAARLGADGGVLRCAAAAAALLHDAGKAAAPYQRRVAEGRPGFMCHEALSAWITLRVLRRLPCSGSPVPEEVAAAAALAVLRHHHGLRDVRTCMTGSVYRDHAYVQGATVASIDRGALVDELNASNIGLAGRIAGVVRGLRSWPPYSVVDASRDVVNTAKRYSRRERWLAAATILTGTLSMADYLAAACLDGRSGDTDHPAGYAAKALDELSWRLGSTSPATLYEGGLRELSRL